MKLGTEFSKANLEIFGSTFTALIVEYMPLSFHSSGESVAFVLYGYKNDEIHGLLQITLKDGNSRQYRGSLWSSLFEFLGQH